ncbi:phage Gp19/Gp15/Gp42 family protein [Glaciihabitans sp. dw_435]|uniref:phage Gp19/Gp15/Gp42 family protein n=1 Tax=Glaciihabitans sp. dw_435 TaxID=2720081 RepID=UPI001BD35A2B|nr:phage Gp19/Gp15/Gp42 family protein [Glaciihabitans sp. dw_435]
MTRNDLIKRYEGDLDTRFRPDYLDSQIEDAVDYADSRWRAQIEMRLSTGVLTPNLYRRVIADAVLRVIRNPDGFASENEGNYGYATRGEVASGNLWFTPNDIATLCGVEQTMMPGSVSIGLDRGWH